MHWRKKWNNNNRHPVLLLASVCWILFWSKRDSCWKPCWGSLIQLLHGLLIWKKKASLGPNSHSHFLSRFHFLLQNRPCVCHAWKGLPQVLQKRPQNRKLIEEKSRRRFLQPTPQRRHRQQRKLIRGILLVVSCPLSSRLSGGCGMASRWAFQAARRFASAARARPAPSGGNGGKTLKDLTKAFSAQGKGNSKSAFSLQSEARGLRSLRRQGRFESELQVFSRVAPGSRAAAYLVRKFMVTDCYFLFDTEGTFAFFFLLVLLVVAPLPRPSPPSFFSPHLFKRVGFRGNIFL